MRVYNMKSAKTGKAVANQFVIEENGKAWFQSYKTIIAKYELRENSDGSGKHGHIIIDNGESFIPENNEDEFSRTTCKYLAKFIAMKTGNTVKQNEWNKIAWISREDLNA